MGRTRLRTGRRQSLEEHVEEALVGTPVMAVVAAGVVVAAIAVPTSVVAVLGPLLEALRVEARLASDGGDDHRQLTAVQEHATASVALVDRGAALVALRHRVSGASLLLVGAVARTFVLRHVEITLQ